MSPGKEVFLEASALLFWTGVCTWLGFIIVSKVSQFFEWKRELENEVAKIGPWVNNVQALRLSRRTMRRDIRSLAHRISDLEEC
jgi:hypothetical protein